MRVEVNGVRLFVDVAGAGLIADGPVMKARPTLILLHGGPGADHSLYKPQFARELEDLCQILYLDHRGNGRSDDGDPALWTLSQWADDIAALCDALDIKQPIVFGASFGGFVAQAFAVRQAERLGALILSNTAAKVSFEEIYAAFTRVGGDAVGEAARAYWGNPTSESRARYAEVCLPYYGVKPSDPDVWARIIKKDPVALHFNGPRNEMGRFDFRDALARVRCPTLVLAGALDPIMPHVFSDVIAASLTQATVTYRVLDNAAHLPQHDQTEAFFDHLRTFIHGAVDA